MVNVASQTRTIPRAVHHRWVPLNRVQSAHASTFKQSLPCIIVLYSSIISLICWRLIRCQWRLLRKPCRCQLKAAKVGKSSRLRTSGGHEGLWVDDHHKRLLEMIIYSRKCYPFKTRCKENQQHNFKDFEKFFQGYFLAIFGCLGSFSYVLQIPEGWELCFLFSHRAPRQAAKGSSNH